LLSKRSIMCRKELLYYARFVSRGREIGSRLRRRYPDIGRFSSLRMFAGFCRTRFHFGCRSVARRGTRRASYSFQGSLSRLRTARTNKNTDYVRLGRSLHTPAVTVPQLSTLDFMWIHNDFCLNSGSTSRLTRISSGWRTRSALRYLGCGPTINEVWSNFEVGQGRLGTRKRNRRNDLD